MLAAEPPRPRKLQPSLDFDLETIVLKCLEREPGWRYAGGGAGGRSRLLADRQADPGPDAPLSSAEGAAFPSLCRVAKGPRVLAHVPPPCRRSIADPTARSSPRPRQSRRPNKGLWKRSSEILLPGSQSPWWTVSVCRPGIFGEPRKTGPPCSGSGVLPCSWNPGNGDCWSCCLPPRLDFACAAEVKLGATLHGSAGVYVLGEERLTATGPHHFFGALTVSRRATASRPQSRRSGPAIAGLLPRTGSRPQGRGRRVPHALDDFSSGDAGSQGRVV